MLKVESDKPAGLIEITIDGPVNKAEYEQVIAEVNAALEVHDKLNVVGVVRTFGPFDAEVWWKDLIFHLTHRNWLHRVALVSDVDWVDRVTRFFAPIYPAEIRTFPLSLIDEARNWARLGNLGRAAA